MPKIKKSNKINLVAIYRILDNEWIYYSIKSIYNYCSFILVPNIIDFPDPKNKIKTFDNGLDHALNAINPNYIMYLDPEDVWPRVCLDNFFKLCKIAPHVTHFNISYFSFYRIWNYCVPGLIRKNNIIRWPIGDCHFENFPQNIYFHNYRYLCEDIDEKFSLIKKIEGFNRIRNKWKSDIWNKFKQNPSLAAQKGLHPFDNKLFKNYIVYKGEFPNSITEHRYFKGVLK